MKEINYYVRAYKKGNTGRKGPIALESVYNDISKAIIKCQQLIYQHEDLYYYSIERVIITKNE